MLWSVPNCSYFCVSLHLPSRAQFDFAMLLLLVKYYRTTFLKVNYYPSPLVSFLT